jgi:hypothetical protein
MHTITDLNNIEVILKKIETFIDKKEFKRVVADICVTASVGNNMITLATDKVFKIFDIKPNYSPFLSKQFLNFNGKVDGIRNEVLECYKIKKINFYSTCKNAFNSSIIKGQVPNLAALVFMGQGFDKIENKSADDLLKKLDNLYNVTRYYNENISKSYPYRMEFRCDLSTVNDLIQFIKNRSFNNKFVKLESNEFFSIVQKTLNINKKNLLNGCNINNDIVYDIERFTKSIIVEKLINEIYIKGQRALNNIKKTYNHEISTNLKLSSRSVKVVDFKDTVDKLFNILPKESKIKLVEDVLQYSLKIKDIKKKLIVKLPDVYYNFRSLNLIEELLNITAREESQCVDVNFKMFKSKANNADPVINFSTWIKKSFLTCKKNTVKTIYFKMLMHLMNINEDKLISSLKEYFLEKKLVSVVIYNNKTKRQVAYKVDFDNNTSEQNTLKEHLNSIDLGNNISKAAPDNNELIRYCNAMLKYANSNTRFQDIIGDLSYGFFLIRNNDWVKNRFQFLKKLIATKEIFNNTMSQVKNWNPDSFTRDQRFLFLKNFNITLSDADLEKYFQLTDIYIKNWKSCSFSDDIKLQSNSELFNIIIKGSTKYSASELANLKRWEQNEDVKFLSNLNSNDTNKNVAQEDKSLSKSVTNDSNELISNNQNLTKLNASDHDKSKDNSEVLNVGAGIENENSDYKNNSDGFEPEFDNCSNNCNTDPDINDKLTNKVSKILILNPNVIKLHAETCPSDDENVNLNQSINNIVADSLNQDNSMKKTLNFDETVSNEKRAKISHIPSVNLTENNNISIVPESLFCYPQNKIESFFDQLFKRCRFTRFNPFIERKKFNKKERIDIRDLEEHLKIHSKKKLMSKFNNGEYMFNVLNQKKCYIQFQRLLTTLKNIFVTSLISQNVLLTKLRLNLKLLKSTAKHLIDDLVVSNILSFEDFLQNGNRHYKLNI